MCGIVGWFDLKDHRSCDRALLHAMSDALAHRGPDGDGHHFEPGLGLGHRRLAVIDLVTERGLASPEEMAAIAAAWRRWGADPAATVARHWFEAIAWVEAN